MHSAAPTALEILIGIRPQPFLAGLTGLVLGPPGLGDWRDCVVSSHADPGGLGLGPADDLPAPPAPGCRGSAVGAALTNLGPLALVSSG
jgi:hypothetical protein